MEKETLDNLFLGISINLIYDLFKISFGMIIGYVGCKYINNSKIKGSFNKVKQYSGKNKSVIDGVGNEVEQK